MKILLLGPPKSGKNILGNTLADEYQIPHLSTNNLLAAVAEEETELGKLVQDAVDACRVSEELLIAVLKRKLTNINLKKGFIISAYPCNGGNANNLDLLLADLGVALNAVIVLDIDNDTLLEEMAGQASCPACEVDYNLYTAPPMVDNVCDYCGGRIKKPPRNYEESIANRLRIYDLNIAPVLAHYRQEKKIYKIEASTLDDKKNFNNAKNILKKIVITDDEIIIIKPVKKVLARKPIKKKVTTKKKRVSKKKKVTKKKVTKKKK